MKPWIILGFLISLLVFFVMIYSFFTNRAFWLFTIMYFVGCYYTFIALFGAFWDHKKPTDDPDFRPLVTVMIPMKNEADVITDTVNDLKAQDYYYRGRSKLEIILVDDNSDDDTVKVVQSLFGSGRNGSKHMLKLVRNPGPVHGKPAALNRGLKQARGEIICVFDADARIPPDFIKNAVPYFRDSEVGGVQGKVRIYNKHDNSLTEIQDDEFASFNRAVQRSRDSIGGAVALGGNGQLTRKTAIQQAGGWKEGSITEDLELSIRLYAKGWKIRYSENSTVYQEAVTSLKALFRQRTRWSQGHIETFLEMSPTVVMNPRIHPMKKLDLMIYLSGIMTPGFVFMSYFFGFIALISPIWFSSGVNDLLWIWASIAFIPVVYWGLFKEVSKNPLDLFFRSMRIFLFCFHWIPTFFMGWYGALKSGFSNGHPKWEKTKHNGAVILLDIF
ncbi:MAG: glycosyltransferase [Thermoplasmatota archaeon]